MKKFFFITIFLIFSLTQKSYSYSSDPKQFISEIVEEAKGILVKSNTKEFKTKKLSEMALKKRSGADQKDYIAYPEGNHFFPHIVAQHNH